MRARLLLSTLLLTAFWGCQNIEDAKPANRLTFIRFYEAPHNLYGVTAEPTADGYVILGNELLGNGNQNTILIQANKKGERTGENIVIPGGAGKALKVAADGYYVIGDSIKINLESSDISDLVINSARIFKLGPGGNIMRKIVIADRVNTSGLTDFFGGAININDNGEIIVLGTFKTAGAASTEKPFLAAFDPADLDTLWIRNYDILDRNYVNGKSVHISSSGRIVWATSLLKENQSFSRSYLGIPYIRENSTFENFSQFGEQTDQQLYPNDIQPYASPGLGFGIVGTYSTPTGVNKNMFFIRVSEGGNIVDGSERFFDGEMTFSDNVGGADDSQSEDTGDAIISTSDGGYVLAGSMVTTPTRGEGGKDIFLVKVDFNGNMIWNKVIGGLGDETVSSIRETADGGLLICGSNNASGLSSIFLMKTDRNGDLKN
jgi:hypothetical protein